MSELSMLDLPYYLSQLGGTERGFQLVGVLIGEIEKPEKLKALNLKSAVDKFAVIDLVGIRSAFGSFYASGRVVVVVHRNVINDARRKESGRLAVVLSGGTVRLSYGEENFVSMMNWSRDMNGEWELSRVNSFNIDKKIFPEFFNVISKAYRNNWKFEFPCPIQSDYQFPCEGVDFKFTDKDITISEVSSSVQIDRSEKEVREMPSELTDNSSFGGSLGVSSDSGSDLATLVNNKEQVIELESITADLGIKDRMQIVPRTRNAELMEEEVKVASQKVDEIIKSLPVFDGEDDEEHNEKMNKIFQYTAKQIKNSWNNAVGNITGRALFKDALERAFPDFTTRNKDGVTPIVELLNVLGTGLVDNWVDISSDYIDNKIVAHIHQNRIDVYLKIIEILVGIRNKLVSAFSDCNELGINMMDLIKSNPYALCMIKPDISVEDLDKLAMLYGVDRSSKNIQTFRNISYMHHFMLDRNNFLTADNTIVKYSSLLKYVKVGDMLTKTEYTNLMADGTIIPHDKIEALSYYIDSSVSKRNFALPREGWVSSYGRYIRSNNQEVTDVIDDYINSGLGIRLKLKGTTYISDYVYAKKELFVMNKLYELSQNTDGSDITDEQIEKVIDNFEKMKSEELGLGVDGFKLEKKQRQGAYLVRQPVVCLTGPAGSGKTTVAELLVYAVEQLLGVPEEEIVFVAPTGKAANRLKEVVKRKTRTINSQFGVGGDSVRLTDPDDIEVRDDFKVIIVDESSMPNINLMYEMLLRVPNGVRIFFLGDKEQLAPIGAGKPFATFLTFLPTVILDVTKRASDKSGISRNAKVLISKTGEGEIKNYPDYRIIDEKDPDRVADLACDIVQYHLGKRTSDGFTPVENLGQNLNPDDIQVITPVNKHSWGTRILNKRLQNIFNPKNKGVSVNFSISRDDSVEYRIGDRVIHSRVNLRDKERLNHHGKNMFTLSDDTGIMNGEVGKVVGIFNVKDIDLSKERSQERREKIKTLLGDNENTFVLMVEYEDTDEISGEIKKFVIPYKMELIQRQGNDLTVVSHDLNNLDLAYALTVHKLQGSQAKLTITIMLPVGKGFIASRFISSNMVYTATTRAQDAEYLLGDILGSQSCITKARKVEQTEIRYSMLDFL